MASSLDRLPYTPLQDLLRGRVTGRLDWRGRIDSDKLAPEVKSLVVGTVLRTRLWRTEKTEVAAELLSHFSEGFKAGVPIPDLIAEFGNSHDTALLVRRAKIRNRPIAWHFLQPIYWLLVFLCAGYAGLAIYYFASSPSPKVNFIAQMNADLAQAPDEQRAWPVYRSALLALQGEEAKPVLNDSAYGTRWPLIARWIDEHQLTIASIRDASKLPTLGFILGTGGSAATTNVALLTPVHTPLDASMKGNALPQLRDMRVLADLLAFDTKRAGEMHDGSRAESDLSAMAGVAAQEKRDAPFYVGQLLSVGILGLSFNELDRTLTESPQLFDDSALVRIAHRISIPKTGSDLISFAGERLLFEDVLQRTFTDDGHGDGRFSPQGWSFYQPMFAEDGCSPIRLIIGQTPGVLFQPASLLVMGSKKELLNEYQHLIDLNDATIRVPLREADMTAPYNEWRALDRSLSSRLHYAPLLALVPSLHRSSEIAEQTLGERDGLLVGISLELYHRRNHRYPALLDELTPGLLPQVPADRVTGAPLKYRLKDGKPLVYSVGVDRIDDGGRLPAAPAGHFDPNAAAEWGAPIWADRATVACGDWVLFPRPRAPVEDNTGD